MPLNENSSIEELVNARKIAEESLYEAKKATELIRVAHLRAVLQEAFPGAELIVFAHYDNERHVRPLQILGSMEDSDCLDLYDSPELSKKQAEAIALAAQTVREIGEDIYHSENFDPGEFAHEGWVEFDLNISRVEIETETCPADPQAVVDAEGFCSSHQWDCLDYQQYLREN